MKDELVSSNTAKLAKEKGFYIEGSQILRTINGGTCWFAITKEQTIDVIKDKYFSDSNLYLSVTQSLLQRWLREKHKIHIEIQPQLASKSKSKERYPDDMIPNGEYMCFVDFEKGNSNVYKSYEEALEVGLQEGLKLIK
jgi:hypothetical protein